MFSFKMGYKLEFIVVYIVLVCAVPGEKWRFTIGIFIILLFYHYYLYLLYRNGIFCGIAENEIFTNLSKNWQIVILTQLFLGIPLTTWQTLLFMENCCEKYDTPNPKYSRINATKSPISEKHRFFKSYRTLCRLW